MVAGETANELIGRDLYPLLKGIADRYSIWNAHTKLTIAEMTKRPRCPCEMFTMKVQAAITDPQQHLMQRQELADYYEIILALAAHIAGWNTLRGGYSRRELLESVFRVEVPRGRPRRVFLTKADLEWAECLVEHVRAEGVEHLRHHQIADGKIVYHPPDFDTGTVYSAQPVLTVSGARHAIGILERTCASSAPAFKKSHHRIAARLLAAIAGCSEETVRRELPERVEDGSTLRGLEWMTELAHFGDTLKKWGDQRGSDRLRAGVARVAADTLDRLAAEQGLSVRAQLIDRLNNAGTSGWSERAADYDKG
jgi:hypothetical protein